MRWRVLPVLLLAGAASAGRAAAQTPRPPAAAGPRDVREVFLALPFPSRADLPGERWGHLSDPLRTPERRGAELRRALARGEPNVLDTRNGYLRMVLPDASGSYVMEVVLTYFTRANGERLVVLQLNDADGPPGTWARDVFWTLSGSRFTPRGARDVLPEITYEDFWGSQPLPRGVDRRFFLDTGGWAIEWPREGTVARFHVFTPMLDHETPQRERTLRDLFARRRFGQMALVWNRQTGRFAKGAKQRYDPEAEEHDHHDH